MGEDEHGESESEGNNDGNSLLLGVLGTIWGGLEGIGCCIGLDTTGIEG